MSNVPKSRRGTTKEDFFDKAISLRAKITQYLHDDFGTQHAFDKDNRRDDTYWIRKSIRDNIMSLSSNVVNEITMAYSIFMTNIYEYNTRRHHMNNAIGYCETIIQELQYAVKVLNIKQSKYDNLIDELLEEVEHIKKWRSSDNKRKAALLNKENKQKETDEVNNITDM